MKIIRISTVILRILAIMLLIKAATAIIVSALQKK
jgi:hypothetical protein